MTITVKDFASKTTGEQYAEETVVAGDQLIVLMPMDGVVTIQLNAASPADTADVYSSIAPYGVLRAPADLSDMALESNETGDAVKRTVENGCTAYAVDVTAGTYTVRMRILRNSTIYRS